MRYNEFDDAGELALARRVAQEFPRHGHRLDVVQLRAVLNEMDPAQTEMREKFLREVGYVWQKPDALIWEPGIPSLMDYMIAAPIPISASESEHAQSQTA